MQQKPRKGVKEVSNPVEKSMRMVEEFHRIFGLPIGDEPTLPEVSTHAYHALSHAQKSIKSVAVILREAAELDEHPALMRAHLMAEELSEVIEAMYMGDIPHLLHELVDLRYVTDGSFLTFGLHGYFLPALEEVQRANLSKLDDEGKPVLSKGGRIAKGPNFVKADVRKVFVDFPEKIGEKTLEEALKEFPKTADPCDLCKHYPTTAGDEYPCNNCVHMMEDHWKYRKKK